MPKRSLCLQKTVVSLSLEPIYIGPQKPDANVHNPNQFLLIYFLYPYTGRQKYANQYYFSAKERHSIDLFLKYLFLKDFFLAGSKNRFQNRYLF